MEAAGIARLAEMRGIPFYCVKGISDGYRDQMPDFNKFIGEDGNFRLVAFVVFSLFRPWYWPALLRMGENSRKAAQALGDSLLENLQGPGAVTNRNGYPNLKR
jgi:adenosylhomocysteine nucleosidase